MALVAALRKRAIPIRDIAVVVRDLETYEEPLFRAALQYGVTPVFWTQLRVTRTRPFALIQAVCDALEYDEIEKQILLQPLEHRWTPPETNSQMWPIESKTVQETRATLPNGARSYHEWSEIIAENDDIDARIKTFVQWLDDIPEPDPSTVESVLDDVIEAYADCGLPETKVADSPALLETEREARAVIRVRTLVGQLRHKFADRLNDETVEQSWGDVAELATLIATQRPGRREHSNARALDVLEANDVWALDIPYVIAVGLTASEWPQETDSTTPPEFEEAVLQGSSEASALAPDTSWTDGRDRDHFADTLRSAATGLVVTRHTETTSGESVHPSPFLEFLNTELISDKELQNLLSPEQTLPGPIQAMMAENTEANDD
jgi:ATP-dependent helicase/nuclease subunit B